MQCAVLRDACLTLHDPQPCSSTCGVMKHKVVDASKRPFRIDVFGTGADEQVKHAVYALRKLRDPVDSFRLRHLDYDLFSRPDEPPPAVTGSGMTMIWPAWEGGYGDPFMWTLIPLGHLLAEGLLPNTTLGISGALYTSMWAPLQRHGRSVCTFERGDRYEDVSVQRPLPRCEAHACHRALSLCMLPAVAHAKSMHAVATLDAQLGLPPPLPVASNAAEPGVLRVLFAERNSWHGRNLLNLDGLLAHCGRTSLDGWRVQCQKRALGQLPLAHVARLVRRADVFVSMHGADVVNGLHMQPGRALVEVVNNGFERWPDGAPYYFLSCFWLHATPVLAWKRIVLPPPLSSSRRPPSADEIWNRNATLQWPLLERVLRSAATDDRVEIFQGHHDGRLGFCSRTAEKQGDCKRGDKGAFAREEFSSPGKNGHTLNACVAACRRCTRCAFVSFSAAMNDCSWFAHCPSRLPRTEESRLFVTVRVEKKGNQTQGTHAD